MVFTPNQAAVTPGGRGYGYKRPGPTPTMPAPPTQGMVAPPGAGQPQGGYGQVPTMPAPVAQSGGQAPTAFDELKQKILAEREAKKAQHFGTAADVNWPGWGGVVSGGLNRALETRADDASDAATLEQGRLAADRMVLEESDKRKAAMKAVKILNPAMGDAEALGAAKAITEGVATLDDFIPKATSKPELMQQFETLASIYGEDRAKQMLATKYESKAEGKGEEELESWVKSPDTTKRNVGLLVNADQLFQKAVPMLYKESEDGVPDLLETAFATPSGRNAVNRMKEGVINTLRIESGATVKEEEEAGKWRAYVPEVTDSDETAQKKIEDWDNYVSTMYTAYTEGVDVPANLKLKGKSGGKVYNSPEEVAADKKAGLIKAGDKVQTTDGELTVG